MSFTVYADQENPGGLQPCIVSGPEGANEPTISLRIEFTKDAAGEIVIDRAKSNGKPLEEHWTQAIKGISLDIVETRETRGPRIVVFDKGVPTGYAAPWDGRTGESRDASQAAVLQTVASYIQQRRNKASGIANPANK